MKKALKIIFLTISIVIVFLYLGLVFLIPKIVNNKAVISNLSSTIYKKTGVETDIKGLNLKISPKLNFTLKAESVDAKYNNNSVLDVKDLYMNYKLLQNYLAKVSAQRIYIDGNGLKQLPKKPPEKNKKKFELKKIPEINIQNLTYKSDEVSIFANNIDTKDGIIKLKADIKASYLKETLQIGESGTLQVLNGNLIANQLKIKLKNSQLFLDGILFEKDKNYDFTLKGENLPVSEVMAALLHFQKSKDPTKKFIENFKSFSGNIKIDLNFNKDGIFGKSSANNFGAKAVWFDIPIFAKEMVFDFKGDKIESIAQGKIGAEKVIHKLKVTDLGTENKEVVGSLDTVLTKAFDNVPNLTIKNTVKAKIVYKIKAKKINIFYDAELNPESDLIYNSSYLGLRKYKRKIHAHTLKDGQKLYLKELKYSYEDLKKENTIITGDGLFLRINDKYTPQYVKCRTNGYAPVSVAGSFGEKLSGGEFKGNLKYNYTNDKITGTFNVRNARYKVFKVEEAFIDAKEDALKITAKGLFKGEKYSAEMSVKNNFAKDVLVYNLKMFLDKLIIDTNSNKQKKQKQMRPEDFTKKVKEAGVTVNNWEIQINEIQRDKFKLNNVKLVGSLKNNIFDFNMNKLNFSDGIISAKGIYDFAKNTSEMTFEAKNINSNKAANMMLNLQDQIEGTANAKVNLKAKDMFRFLDIHCIFDIKEGFLPKLGDVEFAMDNSKYKLSKITNYDLTQKDDMKFDMKGSFDVHNTELKNVGISSWHPESALFLEGNYEMEKQYADLEVYWKYDKNSSKGVRIFYIPVNFILKVVFRPEKTKDLYKAKFLKVPEIDADEQHTSLYRIKLNGDINHNKIDLIFKEVR